MWCRVLVALGQSVFVPLLGYGLDCLACLKVHTVLQVFVVGDAGIQNLTGI